MKKCAALCAGLLIVSSAYAGPEKATERLLYGRPCAVTFEQKGLAHGVPRWFAVIDRNPTDPSFARGNFAAVLVYTAHAIDINGVGHDEPGWEATVGIRNMRRVYLGFDHARRDGRHRLHVTDVTLESCRELTRPNGEP